jgi:hypothetical protein
MQLSQRSATRPFASACPVAGKSKCVRRVVRACRAQQAFSSAAGAVADADQQVSKRTLLSSLAAAATAATLVKPGYVPLHPPLTQRYSGLDLVSVHMAVHTHWTPHVQRCWQHLKMAESSLLVSIVSYSRIHGSLITPNAFQHIHNLASNSMFTAS